MIKNELLTTSLLVKVTNVLYLKWENGKKKMLVTVLDCSKKRYNEAI